ncbi:helix-turn-helix domain-containing protein [Novosphingobium mangrovi (ex Huang et al. 2023)]|uniref:DUF4115 domain-containing protein n=1 Tax=Novosphingobium mangrovi (ex Huang et al. 2023) TaxID=2976432 RepID=A0ABT2HZX7_9SPHN|nr:helix-turn-helix domain-containing protein [Novosphingobium mangrovi (ex Huang et al. 2023)]MCT2397932.1 DUF4115 domain-containing protein [Novosphingobium mangrovi (ex Huang et al. 2023)]
MTAGSQLRSAREAAGLSVSDIASRTKIAERHLVAIEEDRFGDLAARTYAVGFARAYARVLGLDEADIAGAVHSQIDREEIGHHQPLPSFEPGDPARVPPLRLAWLGAAGAVLVIALVLLFWNSFLSPEGKLPDLLSSEAPTPVASASTAPVPSVTEASDGAVVLTSTADGIWLRVTDASGTRLFERELDKGESWTVPADAQGPKLRTGRPDALQVAVGGKAVAPLSTRPETISGVSLVARDLLARDNPAPVPSARVSGPSAARPATMPSRAPVAAPAPSPTPSATRRTPQPAASAPTPAPTATRTTAPRMTSVPLVQPLAVPSPKPSAKPAARPGSADTGAASAPAASASPAAVPPQAPGTPAPVSTDSE